MMTRYLYILCALLLMLVAGCGPRSYIVTENYSTEEVECDPLDIIKDIDDQTSFLEYEYSLYFAPVGRGELPSKYGVEQRSVIGPYRLGLYSTALETKSERLVILGIEIESSIGMDYSPKTESIFPTTLSPEIRQVFYPTEYSGPSGWTCGIEHPRDERLQICEYVSYSHYWDEPLFDIQFDKNEKLKIKLDIEDSYRQTTETLCFIAQPKLEEQLRTRALGT